MATSGQKFLKVSRNSPILAQLNSVHDIQGTPVDLRMKPILYYLWDLDIDTVASCAGHSDYGLPYPWFDLPMNDIQPKLDGLLKSYRMGLVGRQTVRYYADGPDFTLSQKRGKMLRIVRDFHHRSKL